MKVIQRDPRPGDALFQRVNFSVPKNGRLVVDEVLPVELKREQTMNKLTASGNWVNLLDPLPDSIEIGDIAKGLSKICRWGGQLPADTYYSVAQHCVECSLRGSAPGARLALLMHDSAEFLTGDIFPSLKTHLGVDVIEQRILDVIFEKWNVEDTHWVEIHRIDREALVTEVRDILAYDGPGFEDYGSYKPWEEAIVSWSIRESEERFQAEFWRLTPVLHKTAVGLAVRACI